MYNYDKETIAVYVHVHMHLVNVLLCVRRVHYT